MEWYLVLGIVFACLVILMITGLPAAFAFMLTCVVGVFLFWGGLKGMQTLIMSFFSSVTMFALLPIPLFTLMGTIIFGSGLGTQLVDALDKILGRLPGRLSLLAIGAGAMLGTMIGVGSASIAILGKGLVPEMFKRNYKESVILGPITASGTLAMMIPPSALAILLGAIGGISIGKILIAIIVPGFLLAALFGTYIITRCILQKDIAPSYEVASISVTEKMIIAVRDILPLGIIFFAAIGSIYMGIATPSEAAALGAVACYLMAAVYRKLKWPMIKPTAVEAVRISVMVLMIIVASMTFGKILALSGAITGLVKVATSLPVTPVLIVLFMQLVVLLLGGFMDGGSIIMITMPIFVPIVTSLGLDLVWFAVITLLFVQLGAVTPPFGIDVFVMKTVLPPDITVGEIFKSVVPFLIMGLVVAALIMVFPQLALWLPATAA